MNTDKALEMLKRRPANTDKAIEMQAALKIELEKSKELIKMVIEYRASLDVKNPHYGHVGDAKRFNELLAEAINTTN